MTQEKEQDRPAVADSDNLPESKGYRFKFSVQNEVEGVLMSIHDSEKTKETLLEELNNNFPDGNPVILELEEISEDDLRAMVESYTQVLYGDEDEASEEATPALLN